MTALATSNNPTTRRERLQLNEREYQDLQLKCIRYLAEGNSIKEIAEFEGMTIWHVKQVLQRVNQEARDGLLSNMISERLPMSIEVNLETLRILTKKAFSIMNTSKDDRVVLQANAQIASLMEKQQEILNSSNIVAGAIRKVLVVHPRQADDKEEEGAVMLGVAQGNCPPLREKEGESLDA